MSSDKQPTIRSRFVGYINKITGYEYKAATAEVRKHEASVQNPLTAQNPPRIRGTDDGHRKHGRHYYK